MVEKELPRQEHDASSTQENVQREPERVRTAPFAGRIGGNQEFVASQDDAILKKQPDAVCLSL